MVGKRLKEGWLRLAMALLAFCWLQGVWAIRPQAATTVVEIAGELDYTQAQEVADQVNEFRQENGLAPLTMGATLQHDAMLRAQEIAIYFSHTRPNGTNCGTALTDAGSYSGENIGVGYASSEAAMWGWINSQGHRENMLGTSHKQIGVGCYYSNGTWYWVQEFSTKAESSDLPTGRKSVICRVEVDPARLLLSVMAESKSLEEGTGMQVYLSHMNPGFPSASIPIQPTSCTWSTADASIATVDANGVVTAKRVGEVGISASVGGITKTGLVTVVHRAGPAATCTADQTCTYCGAVLAKATGHTPGMAATCIADQTCTKCGAVLAPRLGHSPGPAATCTTDQTCTRCGNRLVSKLGHSYVASVVKPTATKEGYTLHKCSRCGQSYRSDYVPPTGNVSKPSSGGSSSGGSSSGSTSSASKVKGWMRAATTNSIAIAWRADSRAKSGYAVAVKYGSKYLIVDIVGKNTQTYTLRKVNGKKLTAGTTYVIWIVPAVKYGNTYGLYTSNKTLFTATTKPATAAFTSVVRRAGTYAALRWRKVAGAYGYQIQMSTRPTYGFRTIRVLSGAKTGCMKNGLSRKYPYYFRMRAYKKTGGKYVYGAWSKVMKMR